MTTHLTYRGATYAVQDGESALDALIRGGADVAFSCRRGSCQTCVLRAPQGDAPPEAQRHLRPELIQTHHLLPCVCYPTRPLHLDEPDPAVMRMEALVVERQLLTPRVLRLLLETERLMPWTPGQYVQLTTPDGLTRPYSIASLQDEDYYLELHVARAEGGAVSSWLHDHLTEGMCVQLQGPFGACTYDAAAAAPRLLLLASGTGLAPLIGIARDALRAGHGGPIHLLHAARDGEHYRRDQLRALARQHASFTYTEASRHDLLDLAFDRLQQPEHTSLFLAGHPDMVYDARVRAVLAGIPRAQLLADPFEPAHPLWPQDREKLDATPTDPELWEALGRGPGLRAILQDFYDLAFADPRLAPFFHNVTQERAIDKQYEFLFDVFSGEIEFFGLKPFNAHHWMVISDDLFDYREDLFEGVVRAHGLPEHLLRRWMAFHERFRREIVKTHARGLILNGVEQLHQGFSEEHIDFDMVCDGCAEEIPAGSTARMHQRTGQLFCARCAAQPHP